MDTNSESTLGQDLPDSEVVSKVRSFVIRSLARHVSDTEEFLTSGMVSSLFGMQLIAFIEKSFDCVVTDQDLILDNFTSIANISRFASQKKARQ